MAIGDWMKSEAWLANAGHFLAGLGVVLIAALWSHTPSTVGIVTGVLVIYGLTKEYYIDLHYESGETVASSTVDLIGYLLGAVVAWANVLAAHATGHW